jgi:hypothetical protein
MKSLRLACLLTILLSTLVLAQSNHVPLLDAKQPVLEDGTPVKLRISQTVSSADAHVDDRVEFEVLEEVKIGDVVVIQKGALALGTVTEAQPKRRMARGGKLEVVMDSVRLADGEKAALRATKEVKGGGHTGGMTAGIVVTGLIFWPAAPFFLFMHGKDITIPKDTQVPTFVNGNFHLDLAKFGQLDAGQPQAAPIPTQAPPQQAARAQPETSQVATVRVTSTPDGGDVYVDGSFMGNAPSVLKVPKGEHVFRVSKAGFKEWIRDMIVQAESDVTLTAILEKQE